MMVGLSLMKCSSCKRSVSEPNTSTIIAVTSGMMGKRRVSAYDAASATTTATMKTAVATKMPAGSSNTLSPRSSGETRGKNSAGRELARTNRSTVDVGHDEPGDARNIAKNLDLRQRVLADRSIKHQQNGMRRAGVDFFHHAHDLLKLIQQHRLVLQAARRVDEQHVNLLATRFRKRVEGDPGGIGAGGSRDDRSATAPTPDVELVAAGGADRIACGKHY